MTWPTTCRRNPVVYRKAPIQIFRPCGFKCLALCSNHETYSSISLCHIRCVTTATCSMCAGCVALLPTLHPPVAFCNEALCCMTYKFRPRLHVTSGKRIALVNVCDVMVLRSAFWTRVFNRDVLPTSAACTLPCFSREDVLLILSWKLSTCGRILDVLEQVSFSKTRANWGLAADAFHLPGQRPPPKRGPQRGTLRQHHLLAVCMKMGLIVLADAKDRESRRGSMAAKDAVS